LTRFDTPLRERDQVDDLAQEQWVALDDSLSNTSVAEWMRTRLPDADVTLRTDSLVAMRQAARAGLGLAALPCYLGDASHDLVHRFHGRGAEEVSADARR
jgi:DNA-binding transcriptional LysR family regulator